MSRRLPAETMRHVLSYVDPHDVATLHSASLVDRVWCADVVPFLWSAPFTSDIVPYRLSRIVTPYALCLPDETKHRLGLSIATGRSLFNYPSFLRQLDYGVLISCIAQWFAEHVAPRDDLFDIDGSFTDTGESKDERQLRIGDEMCRMIFKRSKGIQVFRLDISSLSSWASMCAEAHVNGLVALPQAMQSLSHVTSFYFAQAKARPEIFAEMSKWCKSIREMTLVQQCANIVCDELILLIESQKQLRVLNYTSALKQTDLSQLMKALASQRRSLCEVTIVSGLLKDEHALESLCECLYLERLTIAKVQLNAMHVRPLAESLFPHLKYIYLSEIDGSEQRFRPHQEISTFLKAAGEKLEELHLNLPLKYYPSIRSIARNCPNIRVFETMVQSVDQIGDLFSFLRTSVHLEELIISRRWNDTFFYSYRHFLEIASWLPQTLRRLDLKGLELGVADFRNLLVNCPRSVVYFAWRCDHYEAEYERVLRSYEESHQRTIKQYNASKIERTGRWMMEVEFEPDCD